ncbi:tyrosine-type recombinase/integrase [Agromyces laixinhei]|uniref:tyrosine-type recombinase/integrase n=1 Tax=Agromyces laixinhei TaxID=2585717 RepID=UPI0012EE17FB|nr:tyrosine-type recombinase/integrase [Agromyces laixinhei]
MTNSRIPDHPSWHEPLTDYLAWLRAAGRPRSTIYQRSYQLRRFAHETRVEPFEATLDLLVAYLGSHGWANATQHAARSTLRGFYDWAHVTGRSESNPAARLPKIRQPAGKPRPASDDALAAGLVEADERVKLMLRLAAGAGLRASEVARVHTRDVEPDLDGYSLRVLGKGGRVRVVPLTRALALALRSLPGGFVFPGQDAGHLSGAYVSKLMSRALPDGVTAHMLRHRFASRAYVGSGRDIRAVQELLGHSSVATTQVYTAVPRGALRAGVEAA